MTNISKNFDKSKTYFWKCQIILTNFSDEISRVKYKYSLICQKLYEDNKKNCSVKQFS